MAVIENPVVRQSFHPEHLQVDRIETGQNNPTWIRELQFLHPGKSVNFVSISYSVTVYYIILYYIKYRLFQYYTLLLFILSKYHIFSFFTFFLYIFVEQLLLFFKVSCKVSANKLVRVFAALCVLCLLGGVVIGVWFIGKKLNNSKALVKFVHL